MKKRDVKMGIVGLAARALMIYERMNDLGGEDLEAYVTAELRILVDDANELIEDLNAEEARDGTQEAGIFQGTY